MSDMSLVLLTDFSRRLDVPTRLQDRPDTPDDQALSRWLSIAAHRNPNTLRSYWGEVRRFRLFLRLAHASNPLRDIGTLLRDATERDVAMYESTLQGNAPARALESLRATGEQLQWAGLAGQPFVTELPDGTIAARTLRPSSVNQALNVLHALYGYWMEPDPETKSCFVGANPVKRLKRSSVRAQHQTDRIFPLHALHAMLALAARQKAQAPSDVERISAERSRWILALLFGLWGRRGELADLRMGDFRYDGKQWFAHLYRKGGKEQRVPVAPWVMSILVEYRQALGLSALPSADDSAPAVQPLRKHPLGPEATLHPDSLYREVCKIARAAAKAVASGELMPELSPLDRQQTTAALERLSPHWFRHTGATLAIERGTMTLEHASQMLGHSSPVVTAAMYYHPEEQLIADGLQKMGAMFAAQ